MNEDTDTTGSSKPPLRPTVVAAPLGALASVVGYVVTWFVVDTGAVRDLGRASELLTTVGIPTPSRIHTAGWFYYAAHFVEVSLSGRVEGVGAVATSVDVRATAAWTALLYGLPVVVVVLAGGIAVVATETETRWQAIRQGELVAVGYLPLFVLGAVLVGWSVDGTGGTSLTVGPSLPSVVIASLAYPVAFGGIGGALAYLVAE